MDLRDIQRLHAQFSTEPFTIDLPSRIAALPAPEKIARKESATARRKWSRLEPLFKRSLIALGTAALVAAAGVGAASLYKSWHAATAATPTPSGNAPSGGSATAAAASKATDAREAGAVREIEASPSRPVAMQPPPDAGSRSAAIPPGLTAEQFRQAVASRSPDVTRSAAPTMSSDEQRATNSPIRRHTTARTADVKSAPSAEAEEIDRTHAPQPVATQRAPVEPVAVNAVADRSVVAASLAPHSAPPPDSARSNSSTVDAPASGTKLVRQPTRHNVKTRATQSVPSSAPEQSPSQPAHGASNEVQIF
jgi:hypothetical protein